MSTSSLRALSQRAGTTGATLLRTQNPVRGPTFSYGRSAAYRRLEASTRQYSEASLRQRQHAATTLPPFALRSHFLPSSIASPSTGSVRYVSFKELREERARQNAGKAPSPKKPEPEPEPEVKKEAPSASSAADEAFAKSKAESDAQWARAEEQAQREEEEAEKAKAEGKGEAGEEGQKEKKKKDEPVEPPHGTKTPWQVFTETLNSEFKASKEWNESTKELSGSIHDFTQNPNVQKARSAYTKAAEAATSTTGRAVLGTASVIGKSAAWTWDTKVLKGVRMGASAVGSGMEKATRPLRETEAYKSVKDTVDDGASQRYGGWTEKEERRKQREARIARNGGPRADEIHPEDPEAGTNVTLHKDSAWSQGWRDFRDNSPVMQRVFGMGAAYR